MQRYVSTPLNAVTDNTPSFVRLDKAYGNGSARQWIYLALQASLRMLGVNSDKMSGAQIVHLAEVIAKEYYFITLSEFLLFLGRFEAGRYERFYGDASYFLCITKSLQNYVNNERNYLMGAAFKGASKDFHASDFLSLKFEDPKWVAVQARQCTRYISLCPEMARRINNIFKSNYGKTPEEYINSKSLEKK